MLTDDKGNQFTYDHLIWAADLKRLYTMTQTEDLSPEVRNRAEEKKANLLKHRGGDSVFTLFLQVDLPPERFAEVAHGHFFYTPSTDGLGQVHRQELDTLLERFPTVTQPEVLAWLNRYSRLNTYEISVPVLKDPSMAPEGKTGLIISLLAEYDLFKKVQEAGWLEEFVQAFETQIIRVINDSVYPMLKDHIIGQFCFTPLSIEQRVASSEGGITGWAFGDSMPVTDKIQIADRSVNTPIPNVYQAGQWVYSPGGVPMSILTGKLASDKVLKQHKSSDLRFRCCKKTTTFVQHIVEIGFVRQHKSLIDLLCVSSHHFNDCILRLIKMSLKKHLTKNRTSIQNQPHMKKIITLLMLLFIAQHMATVRGSMQNLVSTMNTTSITQGVVCDGSYTYLMISRRRNRHN
jgi:hypothetical protein